jgi:uracil-DNA glycosylase
MATNELTETNLLTHAAAVCAGWQPTLHAEQISRTLKQLSQHLAARKQAGAMIYPTRPFRALDALAPQDIKVVILGQDPYHGPGQAQGLAFSVPDDIKRPPSLRNIFLEIDRSYPQHAQDSEDANIASYRFEPSRMGSPAQGRLDIGPAVPGNDLSGWAEQGVLLLNTVLTVEDAQPASHAKLGWETVTDALITTAAADPTPKVFMLWGAHAQAKRELIAAYPGHLILAANHPSPLSARRPPVPFLGCNHFNMANEWLLQHKRMPILWKT